jgi:hypothetical protein
MSVAPARSALLLALALPASALGQPPIFEHVVIDATNPSNPHCKTLADIDGDGLLDAIAASSSGDGMFWYEYPSWAQHTIRASGSWTTDMQAGDIDGDGDEDLVIPNASGLQWYENPRPLGDPRTDPWIEHLIGSGGANHHDVELADIDGDGDLDVVSRQQSGGAIFFWRQSSPTVWTQITISTRSGEGTAIGDIDGDNDLDVAQNGAWTEQITPTSWVDHTIDANWPDLVGVLIADIDVNGNADDLADSDDPAGVSATRRRSFVRSMSPCMPSQQGSSASSSGSSDCQQARWA